MAYLKKILIPTSILVFLKMWNNKSLSYGYEAFTYSFVNSFIHSAFTEHQPRQELRKILGMGFYDMRKQRLYSIRGRVWQTDNTS